MVNIHSISVDGFKGHESLAFETKDINIITGKNNVGKTSVLEAIDLSFNPTQLEKYGEDVDKLLNIYNTRADIQCEYTTDGELGQYSVQNDTGKTTRNISFETPDKTDIFEFINDFLLDKIQNSPDLESRKQLTLRIFWKNAHNYDIDEVAAEFASELDEEVENAVHEVLTDDLLSRFKSNFLVMNIDDRLCPYMYVGEMYMQLIQEISQNCTTNFVSNIDVNDDEVMEDIENTLNSLVRNAMRVPINQGVYLHEPSSIDGVRFINSLDITDKEIEKEDDYAVTLTQIEDSIKEVELIDNLRDFNLDMLVFEENGNRYQLPYDFMGDGFKAIVGLLWELKRQGTKSDIILLEEPENHMHPGYIRTLVRFLIEISKESNIQLFITTHDIDFISEFFEMDTEYDEYLQEEFQLIQIQQELAQVLSYDSAKKDLHELHLDLRGL